MERDGSADYRLTTKGRALAFALIALTEWGDAFGLTVPRRRRILRPSSIASGIRFILLSRLVLCPSASAIFARTLAFPVSQGDGMSKHERARQGRPFGLSIVSFLGAALALVVSIQPDTRNTV